MNHFVFLFPDENHIEWDSALANCDEALRQKYIHTLNTCIDSRYRQSGFKINYVLLRDETVSSYVWLRDSDSVLFSSMSLSDMTAQHEKKKDYHIDTTEILSKLIPTPIQKLVVGGFYFDDCVDRFAKDAYAVGLDVLVDEDLTDMLPTMMLDENFKINSYPNYNPMRCGEEMCRRIIEYRKNKPWLWPFEI